MVLKKVKASDLKDLDTRQRIKETAMNLFALRGFEGASIREIARIADVNVAAVNYHFKSKENLREEITEELMKDFQLKMASVPDAPNLAEYAARLFQLITEDPAKCLNQFKIFLEADTSAFDKDEHPVGWEQFSAYMDRDLPAKVPLNDRLWLMNVTMSYVVHTAVMSSTKIGKRKMKKFFSDNETLEDYIKRLVETLVRDLNRRHS